MQYSQRSLKKVLQYINKSKERSPLEQINKDEKQLNYEILQLFETYFSFPFQKVIEQFSNAIELPLNQLGKKSNEILFSKDMKNVIKKISKTDAQKLQNLIQSYIDYINNNKQTYLCKIQMVFMIKYPGQNIKNNYYMLMEGLRQSKENVTYDIKGYLSGRTIKGYSFTFGKDNQFINSKQLKQLIECTSKEERVSIIRRIQKDIRFLSQHHIMDYSVLFSFGKTITSISSNSIKINDKYLTIGIIDYLQEFNSLKKLQSRFKGLFKEDISAIDSKLYETRIISFLKKYLEVQNEDSAIQSYK